MSFNNNKKLTSDKIPYPRRDSNPQSWQTSARRLTPGTAQPVDRLLFCILV